MQNVGESASVDDAPGTSSGCPPAPDESNVRCECESDNAVEGLHLEDSDNLEHIQVSTTAKTNEIDCSDKSSDSDCDSESSSPSVFTATGDKRLFSTTKYESEYDWLYWSITKNGYMCKICELTAEPGPPRSFIDKGVSLGTHPTRKLETHKTSRRHIECVFKYTNYRSKSVNSMWSKFTAASVDETKKCLPENILRNLSNVHTL